MKLTIIPLDNTVYKDNFSYTGLTLGSVPENIHALQWNKDAGWIEFNDGSANEKIQTLPAWAVNCVEVWEAKDFEVKNPPPPTQEQLIAACKQTAKKLLEQTDWAVLPDVGLVNQNAFVFYRLNLRNLVKNPVANAVFEAMPEPIWS